jgi:urea-proton symporter
MSSVDVGQLSPAYEDFRGEASFFGGLPPLSEGIGYLVVLGFGVFFSFVTTGIVYANKYFGVTGEITSEHFK